MKYLNFVLLLFLSNSIFSQNNPFAPKLTEGNIYALVIGISDYKDEAIEDLNFAHRDAKIFADYLQSPAGGSVPEENIRLLTNTNATISNIYLGKEWLEKKAKKGDMVFFYFSGHGDVESSLYELGFLLAYNTPHKNYFNNAVRIEDINIMANTLSINNEAKVIMITDACHSGKLSGDTRGKNLVGKQLSSVRNNEIRIASCESFEKSQEDQVWGGGRGAFSFHLINGLEGLADIPDEGDEDGDGVVKLNELKAYLQREVPKDVEKRKEKEQNPVIEGKVSTALAVIDNETLVRIKKEKKEGTLGQGKAKSLDSISSYTEKYFERLKDNTSSYIHNYYDLSTKSADHITDHFINNSLVRVWEFDRDTLWDKNIRKDTEERYDYQQRLAGVIHANVQDVINKYLNGDKTETQNRDYYNAERANYLVYSKMLETAMKLVDTTSYFYEIMKTKTHYFNGVHAKIKSLIEGSPRDSLVALAKNEFEAALAIDDRAAYVHEELGTLETYFDNEEKAKFHFKKSLDLVPDWSIPLTGLSELYFHQDSLELSLEYAQKAVKSNPDYGRPYFIIGTIGLKDLDYLVAEENLLNATRWNNKHYLPYEKLGFMYTDLGQYSLANSYFDEADFKKNNTPLEYLSYIQDSGVSMNGPGTFFIMPPTDTTGFNRNDYIGNFLFGYGNFESDEYEVAEKYFRRAMALNSNDPILYRYLGELMHKLGRYMESELYFKFALQKYKDKKSFKKFAKTIKKSEPRLSKEDFKYYHSLHYPKEHILFFLADIYKKWGYYTKSEKVYNQLLSMNDHQEIVLKELFELHEMNNNFIEAESVIADLKKINLPLGNSYENNFYNARIRNEQERGLYTFKRAKHLYDLYFDKRDILDLITKEEYFYRVPGTNEQKWFHSEFIFVSNRTTFSTHAIEKMNDALRFNSNKERLTRLHVMLGDIHNDLDEKSDNRFHEETSELNYKKAVELSPTPDNREKLIQRSEANHHYQTAFEQLEILNEKKQINFEEKVLFAEYQIKSGDYDNDDGLLDTIEYLYPEERLDIYEHIALNQLLDTDFDDAYESYTELLTKEETNKQYLNYTLARIQSKRGMETEAINHIQTSIGLGFNYKWVLEKDPFLDAIRGSDAFAAILDSINTMDATTEEMGK